MGVVILVTLVLLVIFVSLGNWGGGGAPFVNLWPFRLLHPVLLVGGDDSTRWLLCLSWLRFGYRGRARRGCGHSLSMISTALGTAPLGVAR